MQAQRGCLQHLNLWKVLEAFSVHCWACAVLAAQQMTSPAALLGSGGRGQGASLWYH